jgi:hypothetical protein
MYVMFIASQRFYNGREIVLYSYTMLARVFGKEV